MFSSIRKNPIKRLFRRMTSYKGLAPLVADPEFKAFCQNLGYNLTLANFYSSIPMMTDLEAHHKRYDGKVVYNHDSVFDNKAMAQFLTRLKKYEAEFTPAREPTENEAEYYVNNEMFSHSDAMSYYCLLRHLKPQKIFEIGCGFSTMIASQAVIKNKTGKIIANEPYPRGFLYNMPKVKLTERSAQDITARQINTALNDGDVLFVDTTHTVKEGSDVIHIICNLLPNINKSIYVHFHDIFLPFIFPKAWALEGRNWEEQYLLYAYLLNNSRCKVVYSSAYNAHYFKKAMKDFTVKRVGGGSLWLKIVND